METRANFALIGAFTLAVIGAGFMFVLWFMGNSKPTDRKTYRIIFTGSVAGLSRGANVLFNGLKVGELSTVDLMAEDPSRVAALISIDERTPVKEDTRARLESQGLTGVAAVSLTGGSPTANILNNGEHGGPPVIYADRSDFQNLLDTAQRLSGKLDKLLSDNGDSFTATVHNVETFSKALSENSDGIRDFMGSIADLARAAKPLTARLDSLAGQADNLAKAVDPDKVRSIVNDAASLTSRLNSAAAKLEGTLNAVDGFLGSGDSKGMFGDIGDAARSIRKLADNLDLRTKDLAGGIARFTGPGLRQYEALAVDGRKTLDDLNRAVRALEKNPQSFIFGAKPPLAEYRGTP